METYIENGKSLAELYSIELNRDNDEIEVKIKANNSIYIEYGQFSKMLVNSGPLVEGFNIVLKHGHHAVSVLKEANKGKAFSESEKLELVISRVKQFLTSLDYCELSDFQAKCALLLEQAIK